MHILVYGSLLIIFMLGIGLLKRTKYSGIPHLLAYGATFGLIGGAVMLYAFFNEPDKPLSFIDKALLFGTSIGLGAFIAVGDSLAGRHT